ASGECAVLEDGHIQCWGWRVGGAVGGGEEDHETNTPVEVRGITSATQVAGGYPNNEHVCAALSNGSVQCWGGNGFGDLGDGSTSGPETCLVDGSRVPCSTVPVEVQGISDATEVSLGSEYSCALLAT